MNGNVLRRRALRIEQAPGHPLYLFALRADELLQIADFSRIRRDEGGNLLGYQRDKVRAHVEGILEFLNSSKAFVPFPHALILAFPSTIEFQKVRGPKVTEDELGEAGTLFLPLPKQGGIKPAWILDGQQRALALTQCKHRDFPVPVCALVADDLETQRDQFIRVNNARPLSKSLIGELLPEVDTLLPPRLAAKKVPAALCDLLNRDPQSPFFGIIRRASTPPGKGADRREVVTDTALIQMLEHSLQDTGGCLFPHRDLTTGEMDYTQIQKILHLYWGAVRATWPEAWGLPPLRSRLMHSAGLLAMGRLMDRLMWDISPNDAEAEKVIRVALSRLKPHCHWTSGTWSEMENLEWNKVQNLPNHVRMLSSHLIRTYMTLGRVNP